MRQPRAPRCLETAGGAEGCAQAPERHASAAGCETRSQQERREDASPSDGAGGTEGNERIVGRCSRVLGPRSGPGSQGAAGGGSAASPFLAILGERRCLHGVAAKSGDDRRGWGAAYDTGHWSRHSVRQRTHSPFITGLPRSGSLVTAGRGHDSRGARGSGRREGHASAGLRAGPASGQARCSARQSLARPQGGEASARLRGLRGAAEATLRTQDSAPRAALNAKRSGNSG